MNINTKAVQENSYDAIVVGTGISGGWAAKELTEGGLKTLVLERGRNVKHVTDYPTMNKHSWELPYRDQLTTGSTPFIVVTYCEFHGIVTLLVSS